MVYIRNSEDLLENQLKTTFCTIVAVLFVARMFLVGIICEKEIIHL
jgi:hypothetical protein